MLHTSIAGLALLSNYHVYAAPLTRSSNNETSFTIQWGGCGEGLPENLECGQLQVPIDWDVPNGESFNLTMSRINATDPLNRIGSLLFNPGGPGSAAMQFCAAHASGAAVFWNEALTSRFDIICPDPRGVGASNPVVCDPDVWNQEATLFPTTEDGFQQLVERNKARGESCLNLTGNLLRHTDTISAAKDIEAIRLALNDGKLNWLGLSYGTQLGTAYAELYPENIRTMALDADVDFSLSGAQSAFIETATYEDVLDRFFDWCATNTTFCAFQGQNLPKMFDDLISAADTVAIPAPGCADGSCQMSVSGKDILVNVQKALSYKEAVPVISDGWVGLGLTLKLFIAGNNATLFSNPITTEETISTLAGGIAVACLDGWTDFDLSNMTQAFEQLRSQYLAGAIFNEHVGIVSESYTTQALCVGWPIDTVNHRHKLNQAAMEKMPPNLLVNAKHDPSTSYAMAVGMRKQMPSAVLVTRDVDGHTSYPLHGEAAAVIDRYLVEGMLPADGTVVRS